MSITYQVTVWCDVCADWAQATGPVKSLRKELKAQGWEHQGIKDYCPACIKEGLTPKPVGRR